jgi:hypothetical protein
MTAIPRVISLRVRVDAWAAWARRPGSTVNVAPTPWRTTLLIASYPRTPARGDRSVGQVRTAWSPSWDSSARMDT